MRLVSVKGGLTASAINLAARMVEQGSPVTSFYGVKVQAGG